MNTSRLIRNYAMLAAGVALLGGFLPGTSLILAGLAIASKYVGIPYIGDFVKQYDFWFLTAAYGLLFLGTLFRGL